MLSSLLNNLVLSNFRVGDILKVVYRVNFFTFEFTGICVEKRNKNLFYNNSFFCLRNIIYGVAVELLLNFNFTFVLKIQLNKHKRKRLNYKMSKLFYLRNFVNRLSYFD